MAETVLPPASPNSGRYIREAIRGVMERYARVENRAQIKYSLKLDSDEIERRLRRTMNDDSMSELAERLASKVMVPALTEMFWASDPEGGGGRKNPDDFVLKKIETTRSSQDAYSKGSMVSYDARKESTRKQEHINLHTAFRLNTDPTGDELMIKGFHEIEAILQKIERIPGKAGVRIGPMDQLMSLKLKDYMGNKAPLKKATYNSLFLAVEFGTGVAKNVGDSAFVKKTGPTKDKAIPGAWWHPKVGSGSLYGGQRGFHFLYDVRGADREIHSHYADTFEILAKAEAFSFLRERLG